MIPATAQNSPIWGAHVTDDHCRADGKTAVRKVHVEPSGLVATLFVFAATTQNSPSWGDQHTLVHPLVWGKVLEVHVIPSGLVAARFVVMAPLADTAPPATAQNSPSWGAQVTEDQ